MKTAPISHALNVHYTNPTASIQLARRLCGFLEQRQFDRRIAVVCVGTDRSTGDSLGPLTGSLLSKFRSSAFDLFGTLEDPVHALNLAQTLEHIHCHIHDPLIIAIDACLGQASSIGFIQAGEGPIRPGSGLGKELPPVGDIHISAVVNLAGLMEYAVLHHTRLHVVMRMADVIARSLFRAVSISSRGHQEPVKQLVYTQNR